MPKIHTLPTDITVTGGDKLLGTDEANSENVTKNYRVSDLKTFILDGNATSATTATTATSATTATTATSATSATTATTATTLSSSRNFSITGDITASAISFNGSANVTLSASIDDASVTTSKIASEAVDGTKIADDAIDSEHIVDGSVENVHLENNELFFIDDNDLVLSRELGEQLYLRNADSNLAVVHALPNTVTFGLADSISVNDNITADDNITAATFNLHAMNTGVPSSSSSTGTEGQILIDASHIYVCIAANTWRRVDLQSF